MIWLTQHRYSLLDIAGTGIGIIVMGRCGLAWFLVWACLAAAGSYVAKRMAQSAGSQGGDV